MKNDDYADVPGTMFLATGLWTLLVAAGMVGPSTQICNPTSKPPAFSFLSPSLLSLGK